MNPSISDQRRAAVWSAMAEHFLDTETRHEIPKTALTCVDAGLDVQQAQRIWRDEVAPAVGFNLFSVAGEWAGWDERWLVARIERRRVSNSAAAWRWLGYWLSGGINDGVWVSIARCMELLLARSDPERRRDLAQDLRVLARHYFDFCGEPLSGRESAERARLAELYAGPLLEVLRPALVSGEAIGAERRVRQALSWGEMPPTVDLEAMRRRFARAVRAAGATDGAERVFAELVRRYTQSTRHYHTLEHIEACLRWLDGCRALAECPEEVELALWFHDAVYEPYRSDNERRSAELARATLSALGIPPDACRRVADYVVATQRHAATGDGALVVDIDLAILGARTSEFERFEEQIRSEYADVADSEFRRARRDVLQSFAARPHIYRLPALRNALEHTARANLQRRIGELSERQVSKEHGSTTRQC